MSNPWQCTYCHGHVLMTPSAKMLRCFAVMDYGTVCGENTIYLFSRALASSDDSKSIRAVEERLLGEELFYPRPPFLSLCGKAKPKGRQGKRPHFARVGVSYYVIEIAHANQYHACCIRNKHSGSCCESLLVRSLSSGTLHTGYSTSVYLALSLRVHQRGVHAKPWSPLVGPASRDSIYGRASGRPYRTSSNACPNIKHD